MGERPSLEAPHLGKRRPPPPRAPLCRPNSVQSQLARARPVGVVPGPHAHTPRTHSQSVAGLGRTPPGRAVGRGIAPTPGRPTPRREAPPLWRPRAAPQRTKPARKSACCGFGARYPGPHPPHQQQICSVPWPHAPITGCRAWESAQPRTPDTQARGADPRVPSCRPPSAQSQLGRARWGFGNGSPRPHPSHQQPVGIGPRPHARRTGSRLWDGAQPRTPNTQARGAPPRAPSCRPHGAQSQLAKSGPPAGGRVTPSQAGRPTE